MPLDQQPTGARGVVLAHVRPGDHASRHERVTQLAFARQLAALQGYDFGGVHAPSCRYAAPLYFVPGGTLCAQEAAALGIRGPGDLFGGVVPQPFVASKAISHPLVAPDAATLPEWNPGFAAQLGDAVLAGYTVFDPGDAERAGLLLLAQGPLRLKPVRETGGRGQAVVRDASELRRRLATLDPTELRAHGLVLEENLVDVHTLSAGQVMVGELTASYFGSQRLTRSNSGEEVYGGSTLTLVRGGFEALLALDLSAETRHAIEQARRYDAAARACFAGFFASRTNYDIALGRDAAGRARSGVLEQSWRIGGATGPELAALALFRQDPRRTLVRARCVEVFGDSPEPPAHATVYFRGEDPQLGRLTKYTIVEQE